MEVGLEVGGWAGCGVDGVIGCKNGGDGPW